MSRKKKTVCRKDKLVAELCENADDPCIFCNRAIDDELIYGKNYSIGDISCHYFCVLLSSCTIQHGEDDQGLYGFLYSDITSEVERGKKNKCSYCTRSGATLGCYVTQCKKQFHLPCGREHNAVSLFHGNYKSFCEKHAPKQRVPETIMVNARRRLAQQEKANLEVLNGADGPTSVEECVCVICYEPVPGYPTPQTFWPPCCGRDAWFHRICVQRMALSAGMHYLKCPLCNDKEDFYKAVVSQGFYVPDRDAAWELEQNAFAEIYERPRECAAAVCRCYMGRDHDSGGGHWDLQLCVLCGSSAAHAACAAEAEPAGPEAGPHVCAMCAGVAPPDLASLATHADEAPRASSSRARPRMPSRMSLRRTKANVSAPIGRSPRAASKCKNSAIDTSITRGMEIERSDNTSKNRRGKYNTSSRTTSTKESFIDKPMFSPIKLVDDAMKEKLLSMGDTETDLLVEQLRDKFKKPRPLSLKKKIVNEIIQKLFMDVFDKPEMKDGVPDVTTSAKVEDHIPKIELNQENLGDQETLPNKALLVRPNNEAKMKEETLIDEKLTVSPKEDFKDNTNRISPIIIDDSMDEIKLFSSEARCEDPELSDDSSSSTFVLPSEFIADRDSEDSLPIHDTKNSKTVQMETNSSLEISESDELININVVTIEEHVDSRSVLKSVQFKSPEKPKKCSYKFNPEDKEVLNDENINIDVEQFKNHYLTEVDRDSCKSNFDHSHAHENSNSNSESTIRSIIDYAIDTALKKDKENVQNAGSGNLKRKSTVDIDKAKRQKKERDAKSRGKTPKRIRNRRKEAKSGVKKRKQTKDYRTHLSINNEGVKIKIRLKERRMNLSIDCESDRKFRRMKSKSIHRGGHKVLKQTVLNLSPERSNLLIKPTAEVTPLKRKNYKLKYNLDKLKQTSLHTFFKAQ